MSALRKLSRFVLAAALCLALAGEVEAAVSSNSIVTAQTPNRGILQFTSSSTPLTFATLYTAGSNGSMCRAVLESNTETAQTHAVTLAIFNGGTNYGTFGQYTTANGDGTASATPKVFLPGAPAAGTLPGTEGILPLDSDGNPFFELNNGDTLQATFATAVSSGKFLNLYAVCSDF